MTIDDGDLPALVFEGPYAEVLFLRSLLDSAGIEASLETSLHSRAGVGPRLFVRRRDVVAAKEFVNHFRKNGKRTTF